MSKEPPSAEVVDEWLRRVDAEYRSTAIASHLSLWLVQIAASPDLVKAVLRIAREELGHATLSHRVYLAACRAARTPPRPLALDRASLALDRREGEPLEHDVARACVQVFCLGETVAVRLFKELRQRCEIPVARRALDRVLRDEVGHRDFGWTLLAWLLAHPTQGASVRTLVTRELPAALSALREHYGPRGLPADVRRADARWGLMPPARYGEILRVCFAKDYVPRFARVGVDARGAWG